ncbi:MAG TPA: hypothetical protein VKS22_14905 [Candidatus Binataceae bacterium]|nr:hypothetical protein [Candidatus Binataceae bacterium]
MRRARIALGVSLAVTIALGQACAQSAAPYPAASTTAAPVANNPSASSDYTGSAPGASGASASINTNRYIKDQSTSRALTEYLTQHRLPLVGAQVLKGPSGGREVVLYGFTGTDFGKSDAVSKTRTYLKDSTVIVDNRISVNPSLLTANDSGMAANTSSSSAAVADNSPDPADNMPGASSYLQHQNDLQQYAQSQGNGPAGNGASMSSLSPLLIMGLGLGLAIASGGMISLGSGSSGSPGFGGPGFGPPGTFGGAPYNPYPGYPSGTPNSSPYGP